MPTTLNGVNYMQRTVTLPNGDRAGLLEPDGVGSWLVVYTHGNSGAWNQFATTAAWTGLRNWLLDNGVAVVESAGAGNDWGGAASRVSYEQSVAWARTLVDGSKVVVLGRSMGGLVAYWLATQSAFAEDVRALIVNSGTTDLALRYSMASGNDLANMNAAYGVPGTAMDIPAFTAASAGHDPMLFPSAEYADLAVMQLWGSADTTVRPELHGAAWEAAFASACARYARDIREGGDHSATNGSYLQVGPMTSFLTALGVGVTPEAGLWVIEELRALGEDQLWYPAALTALG